jgi:hypothetical protein
MYVHSALLQKLIRTNEHQPVNQDRYLIGRITGQIFNRRHYVCVTYICIGALSTQVHSHTCLLTRFCVESFRVFFNWDFFEAEIKACMWVHMCDSWHWWFYLLRVGLLSRKATNKTRRFDNKWRSQCWVWSEFAWRQESTKTTVRERLKWLCCSSGENLNFLLFYSFVRFRCNDGKKLRIQ